MIRLLHIADVHLDTSFYSKKENIRKRLRDSLRDAFKRAIDFCIEENLDALLIAGDLFDNDKLSFKTEQFLIGEFDRLKEHNIKVFYSTGNHDPGFLDRFNAIKWPENVYIFKDDTIQAIDVFNNDKKIAKVVSCGHKTSNEGRNLIESFPHKNDNVPYIGLVHAMVTGVREEGNHEKYLPCTIQDLESKGYDYWALGHIHKGQKISSNIFYPGNIQGRNPKETGEKGGLLVTIDDHSNITTEFKLFSKIQWHTINVNNLEKITDYKDLKGYLLGIINECLESNSLLPTQTILRIELQGRAFLKKELELEENKEQVIEDLLLDTNLMDLEIKTENLIHIVNIKDYREGDHVLSYVLDILDSLGDNHEVMERLKNVPLSNGNIRGNSQRENYIKELIGDLEEVAVSLMVGDRSED